MSKCGNCKVRKYCDDFVCLGGITCDETSDMIEQIMADVIDEFVSEIRKHHYLLSDKINSTDYGMFTCGIEQIAEQLKEKG